MISVIVPIYNVENYLEKCVSSILQQRDVVLEVILVDDGSTDASSAICDRLAAEDRRIRVIHKGNGGLSDARNAGMSAAKGDWYAFVDSDDFLAEGALGKMAEAETLGCDMAVCNIQRIYEDGEEEPFYHPADSQVIWEGQTRFETLKQPSVCNKLFRKELFEGVYFPKGKYYEDTFVYHILIHRAQRVLLTGDTGYYYLSRRESILGQARYTDRYFDFVEAVHTRALYLTEQKVPYYGEEACLSLYAAVSDGEKYLKKTQCNGQKYAGMRRQYQFAYSWLMALPSVSKRQKLRLILLRYAPRLHSFLF